MWVPLLSLVLGLASVLNTSYNSYNETRLKRFEVTFRIKQETYAAFMRSIAEAFDSARSNSARGESIRYLSSAQTSYFALEPFIDDANVRSSFLNQMEDYKAFLLGVMSNGGQAVETFNDRREKFRDTLFPILFEK